MSAIPVKCPICKNSSILIRPYRDINIYRCKFCLFDFADKLVLHQEGSTDSTNTPVSVLDKYYANFDADSIVAFKSLELRFPLFEKALGRSISNVLEVGCGPGTAYKFFKSRGVAWAGIEVDPSALAHAKRHNLPIIAANLSDLTDQYDLIYFHQVLEHIWEPKDFMAEVHRLLVKDGIIAIGVPNHYGFTALIRRLLPGIFKGNFGMLQYPYHLRAYSKRALQVLCENSGFQVVRLTSVRSTQLLFGEWYSNTGASWKKVIFEIGALIGLGTLIYCIAKKANIK